MTETPAYPGYAAPTFKLDDGCNCGHCLDATYIALLNAAHDVHCSGCGWCEWTGRAQLLELVS